MRLMHALVLRYIRISEKIQQEQSLTDPRFLPRVIRNNYQLADLGSY